MFVNAFPSPFPTTPYSNNGVVNTQPVHAAPQGPSRYLNFMADRQGCGQWRIGWPELHINMSNMGDSTSMTKMIFEKEWYRDIKTIKLQRQASKEQKMFVEFLKSIQSDIGFKIIL